MYYIYTTVCYILYKYILHTHTQYCVPIVYTYYVWILYTDPMVQKPKVNYRIISGASNQLRFRGVITNQSIDRLINVYTTHDCI